MKSIVPSLKHTIIIKVTVSDRLISDEVLHECLCLLLAGLCNWHLRDRNLAEWVNGHPMKKQIPLDFKYKIQEPDIPIVEWGQNVMTLRLSGVGQQLHSWIAFFQKNIAGLVRLFVKFSYVLKLETAWLSLPMPLCLHF